MVELKPEPVAEVKAEPVAEVKPEPVAETKVETKAAEPAAEAPPSKQTPAEASAAEDEDDDKSAAKSGDKKPASKAKKTAPSLSTDPLRSRSPASAPRPSTASPVQSLFLRPKLCWRAPVASQHIVTFRSQPCALAEHRIEIPASRMIELTFDPRL